MKRFLILMICVAFLAGGCSSTVKINSTPGEAKVYIDGESAGITPYIHTDSKPIWETTDVRLTKEGYEDFRIDMNRDQFNVWHLLSYFWFMDYAPEKNYELKKK